jgi:hypothetical protein
MLCAPTVGQARAPIRRRSKRNFISIVPQKDFPLASNDRACNAAMRGDAPFTAGAFRACAH